VVADTGAFAGGGGFPPAPGPQAGGYDIPPPPGFGAPQDPGFGATAPVMGTAPMVPMQQSGMEPMDDMGVIPGTVGGSNPIVTVLLIVLTCGIYGIYLLVKGKRSAEP
jgi:hypothetical protein